jgi:uncharacterized protein
MNLRDRNLTAAQVIDALALEPHPEGGHYRELWRERPDGGGRGAASTILFLLAAEQKSRWHRVDAAEIWLWHGGAPLRLAIHSADCVLEARLGPDPDQGERLQAVVPTHAWQTAESLGAWTLVGCVVAPAFEFRGFELAPDDWSPV